ncbi:hypothetical protein N9B17_02495 [Rhodopirellula sp.]|nr:hypothetical protein [Rhodopirellula sp.]
MNNALRESPEGVFFVASKLTIVVSAMGARNQSTKTPSTSVVMPVLFELSVFRVNLNTLMCML